MDMLTLSNIFCISDMNEHVLFASGLIEKSSAKKLEWNLIVVAYVC